MRGNAIFISWIRYHGRSDGLAKALGIDSFFVTGGSGPAPLRYIRAWFETRRLIREQQPNTIVVMQPPVIALLCVATSTRKTTRIVGDLHTGVFTDPKWKWALPLTLKVLRKRGIAVVTGQELAKQARDRGVTTLEMHDMIEPIAHEDSVADDPAVDNVLSEKYALVPLAYAFDEPIGELIEAARNHPDTKWVLTGRPPEEIRESAPANVHFTGFVSNEDYARLVENASVMVALTTQENTMQRVGYEAIGNGIGLVTSGTRVLREFFGDAAAYVEPTAESIGPVVSHAVVEADDMRARIVQRREAILERQAKQLADLSSAIRGAHQ